jgi:class 3 adenylate cyclase
MKTGIKLAVNTVSIILIFLALSLFSVYFFYTRDLTRRQIDYHREVAKFIITIVDERRVAVGDTLSPQLITDTIFFAADYFDLEENVEILVFHSVSGEVVYPYSASKASVDDELLLRTKEMPEGKLNIGDRLGFYIRYPNSDFTLFIYTAASDLFWHRNQLLYVVIGLWALFTALMVLVQRKAMKSWRFLLSELRARFDAGPLRKQKEKASIPARYGPETVEILNGFNSLIRSSASVLSRLEGKLKECLTQRENLKKLVILYKKYVADDELLGYSEENINEVTSKRQRVASLTAELVGFLNNTGDLYPQVITGELSGLYSFVKKEATMHGGMVNYSSGYHFNVIYGVPRHDDDAFLHAVEGSKSLFGWVDRRNSSDNRSGIKWELKMGLSCGTAVTGTVGDSFVVIGEAIESSKRMLTHAKQYGVPLVTDSESDLKRFPQLKRRNLDRVSTGSDSLPEIYVYEVFLRDHRSIDNAIKLYCHGLEMFLEGRYDVALYDFKKVDKLLGEDPPSQLFLQRCERMIRG